MLDLYRSILRSLPERYNDADMCRDFRRTFETDSGQNVMACLWAMARCGDVLTENTMGEDQRLPQSYRDALIHMEGRRSVLFHILDMATARANANGTMTTIKVQQYVESDDDGRRNPDDRDDGNYRDDDYRSSDY